MKLEAYLQILAVVLLLGIVVMHFFSSHFVTKTLHTHQKLLVIFNERITRIERIYGIYTTEDAKKYDSAMGRMEEIHREMMQTAQLCQQPSITCPRCHMTSYNPNDIEARYCGNCHAFHEHLQEKH